MSKAMYARLARTEMDLLLRAREDMIWFADYLCQPVIELADNGSFAAAVSAAIDKHGVGVDEMAAQFGVARTTISRWKNGISAPQPFARGTVRDWIVSTLRIRIDEIGAQVGVV